MRSIKSITEFERMIKKGEPFVIFKYSTECSLSSHAKENVTQALIISNEGEALIYQISVTENQKLSTYISECVNITDESPQMLFFEKHPGGQLVVTEHACNGLISIPYVRGIINRALGKKAFDVSGIKSIEKVKDGL